MDLTFNSTIPKLALAVLLVIEGVVLFLLYRLLQKNRPNINSAASSPVPAGKNHWAVFAFLVILLPLIVFLTLNQTIFKSSAQTTSPTLADVFETNPASENYLNKIWLTLENKEYNFRAIYPKCMHPFAYPSPPYQGQSGITMRCENGKSQLEIIFTDLNLTQTLAKYPPRPGLEFKEYTKGKLPGWKALYQDKSAYYFFERSDAKNIILVGNLDQFSEPPAYAKDLIEHIAQSVNNLN